MADSAAVLVVGPSWVGDMVMAQALFRQLREYDAHRAIDVVAPAWSLPIVARMPEVRNAYASGTSHGEVGLAKRRQLGVQLREQRYQQAIVLPRSMKAALVPWFARIPVRTGFRGETRYGIINDMRRMDKSVLDQTVKRFVALGVRKGEPLPQILHPKLRIDEQRQKMLIDKLQLAMTQPVVAMMPGAEYGPAKCWPLDNFASLAEKLQAAGRTVWVLGSEKDSAAGEQIAAGNGAINLCGRTRLEDVVDLLALARHAVSNDSGLMHIAASVGVQVHALYGSSTPRFTPPLTSRRVIHYRDLACSPCFERHCPLRHLNCLNEITVNDVLQNLV